MEFSELLNYILGGGVLALLIGVLTLKATVREANAKAEQAKAEAEKAKPKLSQCVLTTLNTPPVY